MIFRIFENIFLTIILDQSHFGDVADFQNSLKSELLRGGSAQKRVISVCQPTTATAHQLLTDPVTGMRQNREINTTERHQRLLQRIDDSSPPKHLMKILLRSRHGVGPPFDIPRVTLIQIAPVSSE